MLIVAPLLIPLATAIVAIIFWQSRRLQKALAVIGSSLLFVAGIILFATVYQQGILTGQMGGWPAPFGITLVVDLFSAIMILITGFMGLLTTIYSLASIDARRESFGYYPLLLILLMGVCGIFLAGDIFNLYVWLEVTLISSFVLMALGGEKPQLRGAIIYVALNLVASVTLLTAVGIIYGQLGTLNMADISLALRTGGQPGILVTMSMLFMIAFGIKSASFPLFFWLPESYHTPPPAVTAIFSALLTKAGLYALIRLFTLIFNQEMDFTYALILVIAGLTMVTGVLGAIAQNQMRRLLSFHIISQIGYPLMGLGIFSLTSLAATVFFIVHVILAKSALFFVSGIVQKLKATNDLQKLGGLYKSNPLIAVLFLIPALALAGIPPFSGFFAKLMLVVAGIETSHYVVVGVALAVSILTLYSMIKIWNEVFWKNPGGESMDSIQEQAAAKKALRPQLVAPTAILAALTLILGIAGEPLMAVSFEAAEQLLNPALYIEAVLGVKP